MSTTSTGIRKRRSLRGRLTALAAAAALAVSGASVLAPEPAAAAEDASPHGDWQTFAEQLPMAGIHIDTARLKDPTVKPVVWVRSDKFAVRDGYVVYTGPVESNTEYTPSGGVTFTYENAATRPDGSTANLYISFSDVHIYTGAANTSKDTSTVAPLSGTPTITTDDGKQWSARVLPDPDAEGSDTWRYGLEARVNMYVDEWQSGDLFVTGTTGMTIDRSDTTSYKRIKDSADHDFFSESLIITGNVAAPVYRPAENYGADTYTDDEGRLHFVGAGRNGSQKTEIDGKKWDDSYLTGFLTEVVGSDGLYAQYRGSGGIAGSTVYKMNTPMFSTGQAYAFVTSSSEGGTVQFTRNGGGLDDGSEVLDPGHYSAPRGKAVRLTMTPDQAGTHPELTINGGDVTENVERHEEGGQVYFTYDVPAAFSDTDAQVTWAADPVPTGTLSLSIIWNDSGHESSRPQSTNVELSAVTSADNEPAPVFDGNSSTTVELTGSGQAWNTQVTDLPETYQGKTVQYTVTPAAVEHYSMSRPISFDLTTGKMMMCNFIAKWES